MPKHAIRNAAVLNGTDGPAQERTILIEDGTIVAVLAAHEPVGDAQIFDAAGLWVLPGLIDAHTHLTLHREAPERHEFHADTPFLSVRAAGEQLAAGVTTVRDLGGNSHVDIALRDAIERGDVLGPRVLAAGQPISATGGHLHYFAQEADGPVEVRKAVRTQIKAGADLIKIMLTGGSANVDEQPERLQLQRDEVEAAVSEADEADRPVAVHAHTSRAIELAVRAGVASIEHGALLDDAGIAALASSNTVLVPTHAVYERLATRSDVPTAQREASARMLAVKEVVLNKAISAGLRIGVGTDSGRHYPQGRVVDEMEALVRLGMSIQDVLDAATIGNARLLRIDSSTGSITPGKRADLVLVRSDPSVDLGALRQVERVYLAGAVAFDGSVRNPVAVDASV